MKTFKEMKNEFYTLARLELLDGLAQCTAEQRDFFKLMYANPALTSTEEKKRQQIEKVVAGISRKRLDWAMSQVYETIKKGKS